MLDGMSGGRGRSLVALAAVACVLAVPAWVQRARACGFVPTLRMGYPAAGATDVPTNVVPWVWGDVGTERVRITLTDSMGAEVPAIVVRLEGYVLGDYFEIRPRAELAPNSFYDVLIDGVETENGDGYFRFTTGPGPATGTPPALGALSMQVVDNSTMSSCGDDTFACVASTYAGVVQVTVTRDSGAVEARLLAPVNGAVRYARTAAAADDPFCVELRARDVAGRLGEPATICSEDVPSFEVSTTSAVTCAGERLVAEGRYLDQPRRPHGDGGGCSTAGTDPPTGTWWLLIAGALVLALRSRGRIRPSRGA